MCSQAGETPLHLASFGGFSDIVELCLQSKADLNRTALVCCCVDGPFLLPAKWGYCLNPSVQKLTY